MPVQPNTTHYPAKRLQDGDRRQAAQQLISRASVLADDLFESRDLRPFLDLLSRFHSYDYRNLLLILDQYPQATILGPFKSWQRMVQDPSVQILKEEWKGRGLDLLIPFTIEERRKPTLVWYAVKQFDISQTNVPSAPEQWTPYIADEMHIPNLSNAMQSVLSYLFERTLYLISPTNPTLPPVLPYNITDRFIIMRSNTTSVERLQNLTEAVARLSAVKSALPAHCQVLYAQSVSYCLFTIWGLKGKYPAPMAGEHVTAVPKALRPIFLDMLQRTVRMLEECTACEYLALRKAVSEDDLDDDLLSELLGIIHPDTEH